MAIFNSYVKLPEGTCWPRPKFGIAMNSSPLLKSRNGRPSGHRFSASEWPIPIPCRWFPPSRCPTNRRWHQRIPRTSRPWSLVAAALPAGFGIRPKRKFWNTENGCVRMSNYFQRSHRQTPICWLVWLWLNCVLWNVRSFQGCHLNYTYTKNDSELAPSANSSAHAGWRVPGCQVAWVGRRKCSIWW